MLHTKFLLTLCFIYGLISDTHTRKLDGRRKVGDFQLLCQRKATAGNVPVSKYRSLKTGIHVIIAKVDGPIVTGQLTFATEACDNDGLPHALEHLVFMGSEDYPYKGILDLLANRCLAQGVNAWTDPDNTAYTVETAGKRGFLSILPIFADHVFYPVLKNSSFTTEIHHITGHGEDAGVVYSEMQEDENSQTEITSNAIARILYPKPSGYRYEAGGMLTNLRHSTTMEKIRKYHKKVYRPENLNIIITGQIEPQEVFEVLEDIENKIASESEDENEPFIKPWHSPPPPFTKSQEQEVVYPSDIEDTGMVKIGWRGPSIVSNLTEMYGMEVLIEYLIDTSASPLNDVFFEVEDPLASNIDGYLLYYSVTSCILCFEGVPLHKIRHVKPLLQETLNKIVNDSFNLDDMRSTLNSLILEEESDIEIYPNEILSEDISRDVLYGRDCDSLEQSINRISWYRHLRTEPTSYWVELIKKYLISTPMAVIRGVPSTARAEALEKEERHRIDRRRRRFGKKGLAHLAKEVEKALQMNGGVPPHLDLQSIPVPSTDNIIFHSLKVYTNIDDTSPQKIPQTPPSLFNMDVVPVRIQVDVVNSNFVQIMAIMDTQSLTPSQRLYLPLLLEILLDKQIQHDADTDAEDEKSEEERDNYKIDKNKGTNYFDTDIFDSYTFTGLDLSSSRFSFGKYFQNVGIHFMVEMEQYAKGIKWLRCILFRAIFDSDVVSVKASKLLNSVGDKKREGEKILQLMFNDIIFKPDSNVNKANVFRQEKFLKEVMATIETNPEQILDELYQVYRNITDVNQITIHMASNLQKLAAKTNLTKPWTNFILNGKKASNKSLNIISDWEERLPFDRNSSITGFIAGIGSEESAYLKQTTPSITNHSHPDLPALLVAISYLTQTEGPLWNTIRGRGLAYDYLLSLKVDEGMLTLKLEEATQLKEAYEEALRIINSHLNGSIPWNQFLLDSARGSLVYEIIEREAQISDVVQQSLYAYYRKIPHDYNKNFLRTLKQVKIEDLQKIAFKYLKPLTDPNSSRTFVVCPPSKVVETEKALNRLGHRMEVIDSLKESRFSHL